MPAAKRLPPASSTLKELFRKKKADSDSLCQGCFVNVAAELRV